LRTTTEIVNYLTRHYQEKTGRTEENLLPEKIDGLVQQMGEFLSERLQEDTPHKAVWDDFTAEPQDNAASLAGILEALFEAQPAVRERVDGFMQAVTAYEVKQSDHEYSQKQIEDSLRAEPGALVPDEAESSAILADSKTEKNPPAYLYNNERAGFESDRQAPVSKPFMVGKNAQVIYVPSEKIQFPFMFMHLGRLSETSEKLDLEEKQIMQENLEEIRFQLTKERPYDEAAMAKAFEVIWEIAPSYANALIESLQNNIDELPESTQDFIIQLHSPLH